MDSKEETLQKSSKFGEDAFRNVVEKANQGFELLIQGNYAAAIALFKQAITLCRRYQRSQSSRELTERSGGEIAQQSNQLQSAYLLSKVYYLMGTSYLRLSRKQNSKSCYVLSANIFAKEKLIGEQVQAHDSTSEQFLSGWNTEAHNQEIVDYYWASQQRLAQLLSLAELEPGGPTTAYEGLRDTVAHAEIVPDVEDLLHHQRIKSINEQLEFSCTQCGECCRSSDNILLSPWDLFSMSRADNLRVQYGITTTVQLVSHAQFKLAFHFVLRDGYPMCYLRPVKSSSGHCYFAYPLSYETQRFTGVDTSSADRSGKPVASDSSVSHESSATNSTIRLLTAEESLTSRGIAGVKPIMNSFGRTALGCLLGISNMPTMCASYPLASELSVVDFWHVRKPFWHSRNKLQTLRHAREAAKGGSTEPQISTPSVSLDLTNITDYDSNNISTVWQVEEHYVVDSSSPCEGFISNPDQRRTPLDDSGNTLIDQFRAARFSVASGVLPADEVASYISYSTDNVPVNFLSFQPPSSVQKTVKEFLLGGNGAGSDMSSKIEHSQWFLGLVEVVSAYFPATIESIGYESIRAKFVSIMARIWFNFDVFSKASRPIKSISRLTRDIETLTWAVVKATKEFVVKERSEGVSAPESDVYNRYEILLNQLLDSSTHDHDSSII